MYMRTHTIHAYEILSDVQSTNYGAGQLYKFEISTTIIIKIIFTL